MFWRKKKELGLLNKKESMEAIELCFNLDYKIFTVIIKTENQYYSDLFVDYESFVNYMNENQFYGELSLFGYGGLIGEVDIERYRENQVFLIHSFFESVVLWEKPDSDIVDENEKPIPIKLNTIQLKDFDGVSVSIKEDEIVRIDAIKY